MMTHNEQIEKQIALRTRQILEAQCGNLVGELAQKTAEFEQISAQLAAVRGELETLKAKTAMETDTAV